MSANDYKRKKKFKPGSVIIAIVLIIIACGILVSSHSFMKIRELKRINKQENQARNAALEERRNLLKEIHLLANDSTYIEEIARKEYGMVKKGEEVFQITLPDTKPTGKNDK
ncbi:MAG: septum formation initiator family protein [Candidatus Latescibacterota bacterium]